MKTEPAFEKFSLNPSPSEALEPVEPAQNLPVEINDPLAIALTALAKLRRQGHSGYIPPEAVDTAKVIVHPAARKTAGKVALKQTTQPPEPVVKVKRPPKVQAVTSKNVTNLEEYKTERPKELNERQLAPLIKRAKQGDPVAKEKIWLDAQYLAEKIARGRSRKIANEGNRQQYYDDMRQQCLMVLPGVMERYDGSIAFKVYLFRRMLGAVQDEERAYGVANGLSRHSYDQLKAVIESDDPEAALHELITQGKDTKRGAFTLAPYLISGIKAGKDTRIISTLPSLEELRESPRIDRINNAAEAVASDDVQAEALMQIEIEKLRRALATFPARERMVLTLFYGLFDEPTLTQEEIGEKFGITGSRISGICKDGRERLAKVLSGEKVETPASRLQNIEVKSSQVSRRAFRERIYSELEKLKSEALSEKEILTALRHLPDWRQRKVLLGEKEYWIFERPAPNLPSDIVIEAAPSGNRVVGRKDDSITILARDITGEDLQLVIDIEKQLEQLGFTPDPEFVGNFSERELEVLSRIHKATYKQIGQELKLKTSTVRTHVHNAMLRVGIESVVDFAVLAARKGFMPMNEVPSGMTEGLSDKETRLLKECYNLTYEEGAEKLGIAYTTFKTHWHTIFEKVGTSNNVQVVMMAMKDGLIPLTGNRSDYNLLGASPA